MKKSLYYSFLLAYVLIFICSFLIIDLWTARQNKELLIKHQAKYLYDSLNIISDNIKSNSFENPEENISENKDMQKKT